MDRNYYSKRNRWRVKYFLRGSFFGLLLFLFTIIPIYFENYYLYLIEVLLIALWFIFMWITHKEFYYVPKLFKNKENNFLWLYCELYGHHIFNHKQEIKERCTTCGRLNDENLDDDLWFISDFE